MHQPVKATWGQCSILALLYFLPTIIYFMLLISGSTNFVIIAILTLALKGAWHFRQVSIFHDKSVHFNVNIVNGWTDAPCWFGGKKGGIHQNYCFLFFYVGLSVFFSSANTWKKISYCQRPTTLLLVVDFVDNIKWIYFFITFLSKWKCELQLLQLAGKLFVGNVELHRSLDLPWFIDF